MSSDANESLNSDVEDEDIVVHQLELIRTDIQSQLKSNPRVFDTRARQRGKLRQLEQQVTNAYLRINYHLHDVTCKKLLNMAAKIANFAQITV